MSLVRLILALLCGALTCQAAEPTRKPATREGRKTKTYAPQPWGPWVEADFPFFSSILDARREGTGKNNLPRACPNFVAIRDAALSYSPRVNYGLHSP